MKKKNYSIDGFIPRRSGDQLGDLHGGDEVVSSLGKFEDKQLSATGDDKARSLGQPRVGYGLGRFDDVGESLQVIDDIKEPVKKLSRRQRRRLEKQATRRPRSLARRIIKWFLILVLLVGLSVGGYTAYKFIIAGNNIFQGSIFDIFKKQTLKQDDNGRSNFLILGTSEDDPGHDAGYLTDSILVVSLDQAKKDVYMFSIPRDLLVEYNMACPEGYSGKVNSYFSCINDGATNEQEQKRLSAMQKLIGGIVGLDIQYSVHANWLVLKDAVDAVGGIDVDVQGSNGAPGVLDRNADWRCNYTCYYVNYDNGVHYMDGEHALYFSMARGDDNGFPTYGLSRSNPDREINQQKVLIALKDKATSTGMLSNLSVVTKLIDALGNNLRTNIQSSEIRTLVQIASEIKTGDIHMLSLIDGDNAVMNGNGNPKAGNFDYSDIQNFIDKNLSSNPVVHEAAPVVVLNGTDQVGLGQTEADKLTDAGFNVTLVDNAPENTYTTTEIYQIGTGNNATASKLSDLFGVTIKKTMPPTTVNGDVHFVIIIGVATS